MSLKLKRNALWTAMLMLQLVMRSDCFNFKQLRVSATTLTTNVTTSYTVFYDRTTTNTFTTTAFATSPLNTTSTVTLTFPTQYSLTSNITCSYQINSTGAFLPTTCNQVGNLITLTGIFSNNTILSSITLLIANVLNPYPAGKTSAFTGTIGVDVAVVNGAGVNSVVTITAAASVCSFTFSPNYVYSTETMVITLTITNQFPANGTIGVQFPLTRLWSQELDSTRTMPISSAMTCGNISSGVNSAIQCNGSTVTAIVTFSNVVTSALAPNTTITFSIANFIAPPTNQPADAIAVTTYSGGSAIDTCNAYVGGLIPLTLPTTQFLVTEVNDLPMVVNKQYTVKFDVTTLSIISLADTIVITFPSGTTLLNFPTASLSGTIGFDQTSSSYYNQVLTLYMSGSPGTLAAGQLFITVSGFVAPPNTLPTGNFQIQIMSNNYPRMVGYRSIQAVTGTISGTANIGTPPTVNSVSTYTFSITLADPITAQGYFQLIFPTVLGLSNASTVVISSTSMVATPNYSYSSVLNALTITSLSAGATIPAHTFTLTVSGVTNPPSTTTTPSFTFTSYYNANASAMVGSGSIAGVTASAAAIDYTKIVVASSSSITSDTAVTYYFSFVVQNPIPVGGFVVVYFPTTIVFDLSTANGNCQLQINSSSSITTPCTASLSSSYVFNFTNPFPSSAATVGTNLTFSILNAATNPPTTQSVSPFSVFTYYSDGSSIASASNVSSFSGIGTPSNFISSIISKVSDKNAEYTSFTLSLVQIATLEANSIIRVTFPSSLLPQASSSCSLTYLGSTSAVACGFTLATNTLKVVSIGSAIAGGTSFSLTFSNVRNALSFASISGFTATTKTALDLYFYSSGSSTNSVSNSIPTQFASITYQYLPAQLNTAVSLQLSFQLSQYTLMPASLLISIDSYFTASNLSCSAFIDFVGSCSIVPSTSNTLRITGSFNNSVMGLTVTGFSSPTSSPSAASYTTLGSFDSGGYKIDQSTTNISFSLACTLPCQSCSSTNTSSCLSCYTSTSVTPSIYYYSPNKYCYTTCPATTYNNNVTLLCTTCDSNCYTCFSSATYCTKCNPNSSYPYLNITNSSQVCVAACSPGMYGSSAVDPPTCLSCQSPCATCSSATTCLSCLTGFFFLNGTTCTTNCTPSVTIANAATRVCDPCSALCRTCLGNINNCTACSDPMVFYNGSCQSSCPTGGNLAPYNGICTACVSTCQTCNSTIFTCLTCNLSSSTPFLVNSSCLAICPSYYYNDSSTGSCYSCAASGQNCVNCSSATNCLSCDTSYVLYNGKCLNYVPVGYVNISGVAVACAGDCATCSITTTNCTSCKNLSLQGYSCVANCSAGTVSILQVCVGCTSPCATCVTTQTTCTSCNTTLVPAMFLSGNICQTNCPNSYYADTTTYKCTACINNCSLCSSTTVCSACTNGASLYNTTCLTICPVGYVGISGYCKPCTDNCETCTGGTAICITCVTGTYFINSTQSCVDKCPSGLYLDSVAQSCAGCSNSCLTCSGSASACTACNGTFLLNFQCLSVCPTGMFGQAGTCVNCPTNCSSCLAAVNCTGCSGANYLYNGECLSSCPPTSGRIVNGVCSDCSTQNCYSCTSSNVCLNCNSGYLFLNAACVTVCPTGYNSNGTHCLSVVEQSLSSPNNSFPVPFTIAGIVLIIACLMSRLQFPQTYLSGAAYSFIAVLEWGALWYFLYLYFSQHLGQPVALLIGLSAMGVLYILNICACVAQSVFLCRQKDFLGWLGESRGNKCFYYWVSALSLIVSHKLRNILFCKLFTFRIFSARLDRLDNFKIFNIFSLVSLVHSGAAIFAAGIAITKTNSKQQLFHECIDVIVLTGLNVALAFFNTHKDKDFFEEMTPDGYSLHKKNSLMQEHLVGGRPHGIGEDGEVEEGCFQDYNHALTSKQALKFNKSDDGAEVGAGYSDSSLADLTEKVSSEKSYEEASVQALDLLDTRNDKRTLTANTVILPRPVLQEISIQADSLLHEQEQRGINFSTLPVQGFQEDDSSFTNYFHKADKSVQGYLDRGVSFAAQVGAVREDKSLQNDGRAGDAVDCSVQKSQMMARNDQSMQYSRSQPRDASFQYSRGRQVDQSVTYSRKDRSFGAQEGALVSQRGVGGNVSMRSQGNQLSAIDQEDQEIQIQIEREGAGIQPTLEWEDVAIQPDLDYDQLGVQPNLTYEQVAVQPSLDPSANEMAIQYQPMELVQYDELQQEIRQSNTASNVLFQPDEPNEEQPRQLAEEQVEHLQLRNQDMRSYQQELEERIRNKEKELQQIRRKVDFKQRTNAAKKQQLAQDFPYQEPEVELQAVTYVEQRPNLPKPQPRRTNRGERISSNQSQLVEQIDVRRGEQGILQFNKPGNMQPGIERKQMPKESPYQPPLHASQSSASNPLNDTLEQIKMHKQPQEVMIIDQPQKQSPSFKKESPEKANSYKQGVSPSRQPAERLRQQSERLPYASPSDRVGATKMSPQGSPSQRSPSERLPAFKQQSQHPSQDNRTDYFRQPSEKPYSQTKRERTIEQYKQEEPSRDVNQPKRQRTIEEIRLQEVRPNRTVAEIGETRSEFTRSKPQPPKQRIEYKEYEEELRSQDSEQPNMFIRSNDQPTPKRNEKPRQELPRNIEIRDMGNVELETGSRPDRDYDVNSHNSSRLEPDTHLQDRQVPRINLSLQNNEEDASSQGNRESQATKKNNYANNRNNVVVDITEIDQSLHGDDDIELEASFSDREPAGIAKPYHTKPNRNHSPSDLSGTIEEIPKHQLAFDDQKTVSNPDGPQRLPRPQITQQQLTNIFAGSLPAQQKAKKNMPAESGHEQLRINKLYDSNNAPQTTRNEEVMPRNNQKARKSTLAQAGRAQLAEDTLAQKKVAGKSPLKVTRHWEAQHENRYVEEEEDFSPTHSNRNNLVRRPANLQNFASHLVLPQETDKQDTSFQHPKRDTQKQESRPRREPPFSGKTREPQHPEQTEVHFEAEQLSRDLSLSGKNGSPEVPRAYGRQPSKAESSLLGEEQEGIDYRQMMIIGQMQERPQNADLQEYYRKQSKQKRRKSNSKLDRSTEKIYMQKLDKKR